MEEKERHLNLWPLFTMLVAVAMAGTMYWYALKQQAQIDALNTELIMAQAHIAELETDAELYRRTLNSMQSANTSLRAQAEWLQCELNEERNIYPSTRIKPGTDLGLYVNKSSAEQREKRASAGAATPGKLASNAKSILDNAEFAK